MNICRMMLVFCLCFFVAIFQSLTTSYYRTRHNEKLDIRFTEGNQEGDMDYPILEILLYNLRHTQHHIGQLNLIMRQDLGKYMEWAFRVDELN